MAKSKTEIPMTSPDGRPWNAETEAEAFELQSAGYTRNDSGKKNPPADGARTGKSGTSGSGASSGESSS